MRFTRKITMGILDFPESMFSGIIREHILTHGCTYIYWKLPQSLFNLHEIHEVRAGKVPFEIFIFCVSYTT